MFSWAGFLTYALVTTVSPGPNTLSSMSNGGRLGFRRALPFNFGIWAGFSIVMAACTAFCALLEAILPRIKLPMLILGAAYMLYLAYKMWRSGPAGEGESGGGFFSGFALQFVNPKIYIYGVVSMEAYILPYYAQRPLTLLFFALLLAFIGFLLTLLWSAFGSVFRLLFSKHARATNTVMALLLVWCAVSLFL